MAAVATFVIANIAKVLAFDFKETLKCPLIPEVLSSIVWMKLDKLVEASSWLSMYKKVAEERVALLNLNNPTPGSESVNVVLNV